MTRFHAEPSENGARIVIEVEGGERLEAEASFEQLEEAADLFDDILADNDDALEVKDEEDA
jgi:hypothetical protein